MVTFKILETTSALTCARPCKLQNETASSIRKHIFEFLFLSVYIGKIVETCVCVCFFFYLGNLLNLLHIYSFQNCISTHIKLYSSWALHSLKCYAKLRPIICVLEVPCQYMSYCIL